MVENIRCEDIIVGPEILLASKLVPEFMKVLLDSPDRRPRGNEPGDARHAGAKPQTRQRSGTEIDGDDLPSCGMRLSDDQGLKGSRARDENSNAGVSTRRSKGQPRSRFIAQFTTLSTLRKRKDGNRRVRKFFVLSPQTTHILLLSQPTFIPLRLLGPPLARNGC